MGRAAAPARSTRPPPGPHLHGHRDELRRPDRTTTIDYTVSTASPPTVTGGAPTRRRSAAPPCRVGSNPGHAERRGSTSTGWTSQSAGRGVDHAIRPVHARPSRRDPLVDPRGAPPRRPDPGRSLPRTAVATNGAGTTFGADETFTTPAAAAPPPPVLGQSENVSPVTGTVFIESPSGTFVPLTGATQIRTGTVVDALHGSLELVASSGSTRPSTARSAARSSGWGKPAEARSRASPRSR